MYSERNASANGVGPDQNLFSKIYNIFRQSHISISFDGGGGWGGGGGGGGG